MAATERRVGSSRRGMTVLGKVPVAPKPVNLPSQRLENQGLIPDVDTVPWGMSSWGSAGRFSCPSGNKVRKSDRTTSIPLSCGEQGNGGKAENKSVLSISDRNSGVDDGGGLPEASGQLLSAEANSIQAFKSKGKIEEPRNSNSYTCGSVDSQKQETQETPLQTSGDGSVQGVSIAAGFGDFSPQCNHSKAGVPTSDLQSNRIGPGMYSNTSQQNGLHSFPGVPHQNGRKEREIIVIHMVGSPDFYGNYPPQLGYPDNYTRSGLYGNLPLQFGNFEPYSGFQGHGRLDGVKISPVMGSHLFNGHEQFICYEKECYLGRQKNDSVQKNFLRSTFLGGAQRDDHEALISRTSFKSRRSSQEHLSRNVGRLRSSCNNGRSVPIEEASAVPEKRITLLTKASQQKMPTTKSLEETGIGNVAHAEGLGVSVFTACGDEGKAPETLEVDTIIEDAQVEKSGVSADLKMADELSLPKETELESTEVVISTATCNDCFHCKAEASTLQCCLRLTEEVDVESIDKSNSTDGCAVEVKHVIFDADNGNLVTVKSQEGGTLSSVMEAAGPDELLDMQTSTAQQKSLIQNNSEGKGNKGLCVRKVVAEGKWKPKWSVGGAKVDFKVFAPKIRKAVIRKNTSKTFSDECVFETSSSAMCNKMDLKSNVGSDTSHTETCKVQRQLSSLASSLSSSGNVSVDDSHISKENLDGAAVVDCITTGHVQKKKGKNSCKESHDNVTAIHVVESLVKTVSQDISSTDTQKQEPKGEADTNTSTNEKAWRPKAPTALQSKSAIKVSGIRVSKAQVDHRKLETQGMKSHSVTGTTVSAKNSEVVKEQGDAVQNNRPPSTSHFCNSEVLKINTSQPFKGPSKNSSGGQQNLVFRKRSAEQAALEHQSATDTSIMKQPIGSFDSSSKGQSRPEHTKQSLSSTSSRPTSVADGNFSVSASEYHLIQRRVYHVVEGSGADYVLPSLLLSEKSHQTGKYKSLQASNMKKQTQLQKETSSASSCCAESVHSEEVPESMCMPFSSGSEGIPHLGVDVDQPTSRSLLSSSGSEESRSKKHLGHGKGSSAWKPKGAPKTSALEDVSSKKDNNDGASKGIRDYVSSSQGSPSSHLHAGGENDKERVVQNLHGPPMELETVCYETLKEINRSVNQEGASQGTENEDIVDSQKVSEIVVFMEGTEQKHAAEVPSLESLRPVRCSKEEEEAVPVLKQINETCSQETAGSNHIPFKKKNVMSYEKANRYHQIIFKRYKQTGHWKPKAELHNEVLKKNVRASQNDIASMKVPLLVS